MTLASSLRPLRPFLTLGLLCAAFYAGGQTKPTPREEVRASGCTQTQLHTVENYFLTSQNLICLGTNAGLIGTSTAVKDLMAACNFAPTVEPSLIAFLDTITNNPSTIAALHEAAVKAGAKRCPPSIPAPAAPPAPPPWTAPVVPTPPAAPVTDAGKAAADAGKGH